MLARHLALEILKSQLGVGEGALNNTGARVEEYQTSDNIAGGGYAWCVAFYQWARRLATGGKRVTLKEGKIKRTVVSGGKPLFGATASCEVFTREAAKAGRLVDRPLKGDVMILEPGVHLTTIEKVLSLGPLIAVQTIEGNTTSAGALSTTPHNRDGVYRKRRLVRRGSVSFVRVPGEAKAVDPLAKEALARLTPKPKKKAKPKPKPKPRPGPKRSYVDQLDAERATRPANQERQK